MAPIAKQRAATAEWRRSTCISVLLLIPLLARGRDRADAADEFQRLSWPSESPRLQRGSPLKGGSGPLCITNAQIMAAMASADVPWPKTACNERCIASAAKDGLPGTR